MIRNYANIIKFIPIVNMIYFFRWIQICVVNHNSTSSFFKGITKMMLACVIVNIPRIILYQICTVNSMFYSVLYLITFYIMGVAIAHIEIKEEKKFDSGNEKW